MGNTFLKYQGLPSTHNRRVQKDVLATLLLLRIHGFKNFTDILLDLYLSNTVESTTNKVNVSMTCSL